MSEHYRRLAAGLPERRAPSKNSFSADPKVLSSWIAALPMANAAATTNLLLNALRELNQLRIDAVMRIEALEALRGPANQIATVIDRQIIGASFPLPAQKQQLGVLAQDFQRELALGYRIALFDLCAPAGAIPFLKGKYAALAAARAISHLGAWLSKAYLLYLTPPEGSWLALHSVFRFIVSMKLDDKSVADPLLGKVTLTPGHCYSHVLLHAVCNPYRYTQKENSDLYAVTRVWASMCEVRSDRAPDGAQAIPMDHDRGPGYLPEERGHAGAGMWSFETSALVRHLEHQIAVASNDGQLSFGFKGQPGVPVESDLVRRAMHTWHDVGVRSHQRLQAGHQLDSVIGLHALHYFLAGNQDFDGFMRAARGVAISLSERDRVASWATGAAEQTRPTQVRVKVLDQSLGGYRLLWEKGDLVRAKVGELVGLAPIAEDEELQDWMVGVIRWLRIDPRGGVDAGIELLARRALPIGLRGYDSKGQGNTPMRGIQLEPLRADAGPEMMLLAPHVFDRDLAELEITRAADPFAWKQEGEVERLRSPRFLENTGAYVQMAIALEGEASASAPSVAANDDNTPAIGVVPIRVT